MKCLCFSKIFYKPNFGYNQPVCRVDRYEARPDARSYAWTSSSPSEVSLMMDFCKQKQDRIATRAESEEI